MNVGCPDSWLKGWVFDERKAPITKRRQQDSGGIIIWAGVIGLIGSFKVVLMFQ